MSDSLSNPLPVFIDRRGSGDRLIWKWRHYLDIYHRHLARFRGTVAHVLEIGVYGGGSLEMWRDYFGPLSSIYGIDIDPRCEQHAGERIRITVGDQADPVLWEQFRRDVPVLDVVIDDGSHESDHQIATLEALLPHLRPGGVYICEDVHHAGNAFASHVYALADKLNAVELEIDEAARALLGRPEPVHALVASIHLYPFVTVIERALEPVALFTAPQRGSSEWNIGSWHGL
jgi:predicted O-methyltransferase YrrM